jgi:beta-phosphoglucomutase family hydrolase
MFALRGAIFDWDGVVIDSHAAHERAWEMLAAELAAPLPPGFFKATFGMRNDRIIPGYTGWAKPHETELVRELGLRKEAVYRDVIRCDGIAPLPGVVKLLRELQRSGIPCAVGSSTDRENIELIMSVTGLTPYFAAIAAAEDVQRGKPDPQVFLCAAEKIGRDPRDCVVFEDAPVGIEAALRAGARAIAVCTTHPPETFASSGAHRTVRSLEEVDAATLRDLREGVESNT